MLQQKKLLLSAADALNTVKELDRSLAMHQQWLKDFHKMMICQELGTIAPPNPDAHRHCDFGQWYKSLSETLFVQEESIRDLHEPHKKMHLAANDLLSQLSQSPGKRQSAYEEFINTSLDFKLAIRQCQTKLIQRVCTVDHLTGTWNRHTMESRLHEEAERVNRGFQTCAICIVDIDYFKRVNDQYGHPVGDKVLSVIARYLIENLRAYDITFRYGGEEFLICLPDASLSEAAETLDRIRENLAVYQIDIGRSDPITLTASFGLTAIGKDELITDAIARADHALLSAKSQGRNRVCVWD
jgi:diguanylate cyclase (GGDEF)-like protein